MLFWTLVFADSARHAGHERIGRNSRRGINRVPPPEDFYIDRGQCNAQAFSVASGNLLQIAMVQHSCLEGKGWVLVTEPARPHFSEADWDSAHKACRSEAEAYSERSGVPFPTHLTIA